VGKFVTAVNYKNNIIIIIIIIIIIYLSSVPASPEAPFQLRVVSTVTGYGNVFPSAKLVF